MSASLQNLKVMPDVSTWVETVRAELIERLDRPRNQAFSIALTGGSAAKHLYGSLATSVNRAVDLEVFWGDERAVPPDHPDSNFGLANELWFEPAQLPQDCLHRMPAEQSDLEAAARQYESTLYAGTSGGSLDLVHLGMGPDGHVCSLFPGHALLSVRGPLVAAITDSPKPPSHRLTLTLDALRRAKELWFLVLGAGKREAVTDVLLGRKPNLPAALVNAHHPNVHWFLDAAAAGGIDT